MNFFKEFLLNRNRKKVFKKIVLWGIIGFFVLITIGFIAFGDETKQFIIHAVDRFGLLGLFGATVLMDTVIQPFSPDMIVFGYTALDQPLLITALVGGLGSVTAGVLGYGIGSLLEEEGIDDYVGRKNYKKIHNLFMNHGILAILIGALSPVPFSSVCWSAGIFKMPFRVFLISIFLTRLPRFLFIGYLGSIIG